MLYQPVQANRNCNNQSFWFIYKTSFDQIIKRRCSRTKKLYYEIYDPENYDLIDQGIILGSQA